MIDPYRVDGPAVISFSGGATSGFMLWHILQAYGGKLPDDIVPVFANTGLEHPKTLEFIRDCEKHWGVKVRWVEYTGRVDFREVDFESASRNGEPFSLLIEVTQRLPSMWMRHCTGKLKMQTILKFAQQVLGFKQGWTDVIGLRYDEPRRVAKSRQELKSVDKYYPMYQAKHTLADVEAFWNAQPFRLGIEQHLGNCVGCFLKGKAKIERIASENPEFLEWWANAESLELVKNGTAKTERFNRDRPSYRGLIQMAQSQQEFRFPDDDNLPCNCTD
jgi:3'-phosphoadenosine 5'-phosphosulfate sulfotransferase (PAPS reductase)/FAD synthetase